MVELSSKGSVSALALQFLILTATRTSEVLQAQWNEIDREAAVWTIPPERTKTRREHRVPLSDATLSILESLRRIEGNPYLFPGARHGRPLSNMAFLQLMRHMGYGVKGTRGDYVPHGFRSSFRDWSGEVSSFPRDVAEMALAMSQNLSRDRRLAWSLMLPYAKLPTRSGEEPRKSRITPPCLMPRFLPSWWNYPVREVFRPWRCSF